MAHNTLIYVSKNVNGCDANLRGDYYFYHAYGSEKCDRIGANGNDYVYHYHYDGDGYD